MDYTRQQLMSMYRALPQDLKEALYSIDTTQAIQAVSRAYGLHVDQMGELSNAIGQVMLGALHPRDFTKHIKSELAIDEQKASALTREVNLTVFTKIRESLKRIHSLREDSAFETAVNNMPDRESLLRDIEEPPRASSNEPQKVSPAATTTVVQEKKVPDEEQTFSASIEPLLHIPRKVETKAPDPYRELPS